MRHHLFALAGALCLSVPGWAQIPDEMRSALSGGDAAGLVRVLDAGADPNARETDGLEATALMYAASNPDPALVEILVAAGADPDTHDAMGDPAVNWAAYYGHAAVIAALLEAGASTGDTGHGTPVEIVMRRGHQAALAILLDAAGGPVWRSRAEAMLEAAAITGDIAEMDRILPHVRIAQLRDWAGRPVLQAPARAGRAGAIDRLIAAGADVDAVDAIGFTALFEAAREGHRDAVEALVAQGADINRRAGTNGMALTPLHMAAIGGHADLVRWMVEAGADADTAGVTGATPLFWAAFERRHGAVLALLDAGADPGIVPDNTPDLAAIAEMMGWTDVTERLEQPRLADQ
ncbi:ankyrin repeat domain-containing protein [Maricaulis sp.]|uniref:ankyrin repeat domain-containing protein n=1 Tax=Maricaulis sp. TaxID=1486257 RepID=UPI002632E127|nr:ankyrin repeat domain-containing protein [Maricaulis sp.]